MALIDQLPAVRGSLQAGARLSDRSWFGVGGPAEVLFLPADVQDLQDFLAALPDDVPVMTLGRGSNMLIRDGGVPGVVIKLEGPAFETISVEGNRITAGAGAADLSVAIAARKAGIDGMTFLVGVPGTIGGALRMNAGIGPGKEMRNALVAATAVNRQGEKRRFNLEELGYSYRHCALDPDWIFVEAELQGPFGDVEAIAAAMKEHQAYRRTHQPINKKTGGSTFKNHEGYSAWRLVDEAGGRGFRVGGASMSELHCNFMINDGSATAADLETLGQTIREKVKAVSGIELQWEIKRIGKPA
jgi:UDP-N-acetylmuramate dehydrogenase